MVGRVVVIPPDLKSGRSFAFTLFNYSADHEHALRGLGEQGATYLIFGREVCPRTNRPHLQAYVRFSVVKRPKAVMTLLPDGIHIENAKGTAAQSQTYCSKEGDFEEFGECPGDRASAGAERGVQVREEWDLARVAAAEGRFDDIPSSMYIRNFSSFHKIRQQAMEAAVMADNNVLRNFWYYGASGCGKSRTARFEFPTNHYRKAKNKWWGGYDFQPVVLVDDVDPDHSSWIGAFLKEWSDHYRFSAEVKNGGIVIRPSVVIVTSQYRIDEVFKDPETVSALQRRFVYRKFGPLPGESFWHPDIAEVDLDQLLIPLPSDDTYVPEPGRIDPWTTRLPRRPVEERVESDNDTSDEEVEEDE